MMKSEFERIAKIEVTEETYRNIIEPMYLATNLSKSDFVAVLNLKSLAFQKTRKKCIKKMCIRDKSGFLKTPNDCWYNIKYVELIDVNIKTGKFTIKALEDEDFKKLLDEGCDLNYSTCFDFDYTQCIDVKKKAINLVA